MLVTAQRIESPSLSQVLEHVDGVAIELVFHSPSHNASMNILHGGVGVAFWYCEHNTLSFGDHYYKADGTGQLWVSVSNEDSLELIHFNSGQDVVPRVFFVDDAQLIPVIDRFLQTGTRAPEVEWSVEDDVIEQLGERGCFDEIE